MFISTKQVVQKMRSLLPALPAHYRTLSRVCINPKRHAVPITADFVRFTTSGGLPIRAPAQVVALYRCRLCGRTEVVGRHFSKDHPVHLGTIA